MVRVLAVSDEVVASIHDARVRELRPDLVLAAGDLPWDYLEFLASCLEVPVVFVPGNHDPAVEGPSGSGPRGVVNADGRTLEVVGLRVAGLGGCVRYNNGSHQYTQQQYDRRARKLLKGVRQTGAVTTDVLLTHAPPLGLGDEPDPCHVGISALHGVIETLRPAWHLHGHIHPYGMRKPDRQVGPTTIRNVIPWQLIEMEPQMAQPSVVAVGGRG